MPTTAATINALLQGAKERATRQFTDLHRRTEPGAHLFGVRKAYRPHNELGDQLPDQRSDVQVVIERDVFPDVRDVLGRLWQLQLTQDATNAVARADVVVNGETILTDVPVTFLLFLDKQLEALRKFIRSLARLDASEQWHVDQDTGAYASDSAETVSTKKLPRPFVKWEPPSPEYRQDAQVEVVNEDVLQGFWTTVKLSGAVPGDFVRELERRVQALIDAVKVAREEANKTAAVDRNANQIFAYVFDR